MSDDGSAKKLVGLRVPKGAKSTKQGPRVFDTRGRFAPATFEEVNLTVVPAETVQWLSDGLPLIADGILRIEDSLEKGFGEIKDALGQVQGTTDKILLSLNQDLRIDLEDALKLLRRADRMGDAAQGFFVGNEERILKPLRKVEMIDEERLKDALLPPRVHICLMERLLLLRHVHAHILLACGDESDAHELLKRTAESILSMVTALFAKLTNGVDVLDVPEADSPDSERKFLQFMEIIDGISPDDRRFRLKEVSPPPPGKIHMVHLESRPKDTQETDGQGKPQVRAGTRIQKGQVVCVRGDFAWYSPVSGFLTVRDLNIESQTGAPDYPYHPADYLVLAYPTLDAPRPGLADLITELARIVVYARGLEAKLDTALENGELAKMLFAPSDGEPVN